MLGAGDMYVVVSFCSMRRSRELAGGLCAFRAACPGLPTIHRPSGRCQWRNVFAGTCLGMRGPS